MQQIILIIIIIILPSWIQSEKGVSPYEACSFNPSFKCGNFTNIGYPFYWKDIPAYCGHPGFELDCENGTTTMDIRSVKYRVINITRAALKISRWDFSDGACPDRYVDTNLDHSFFNYSSADEIAALFYNCNYSFSNELSEFKCNYDAHRSQRAYLNITKDIRVAMGLVLDCKDHAVVPILKDVIEGLMTGKFGVQHVLNQGFEVSYSTKDENDCIKCALSGGMCGYENSTSSFNCFCVNGTNSSTCSYNLAPAPATTKSPGNKLNVPWKVIIGLSAAGSSILVMLIIFYFYRRRTKKKYAAALPYVSRNISSSFSSATDIEKMGSYFGLHIFSNLELEEATNNFDTTKELGDGGFGTVYYGKLKDGRAVAVKRLYENNYKRVEQFMNEVEILTRLRHKNLVQLYGCTSRCSHELLLVYEYVCNGTVFDHLHGDRAKPGFFPWETRLKIAVETASALAYLHASEVIHRDVKTNNILLDSNFCVKVADFGLSRLFPLDVTHVSTAPQGTPGYVDPDYHQCYQLTAKSDVYSFGVVLIELISSKPAVDITRHRHEINLSNMAINKIQNHELHELVDPSLGFETDSGIHKMVSDVAELAFQCLQSDKDNRPCMGEVLERLTSMQSMNVVAMKPDEFDISKDDVVLLKHESSLSLSPTSVAQKWHSSASTPYGSGLSNNAPKT